MVRAPTAGRPEGQCCRSPSDDKGRVPDPGKPGRGEEMPSTGSLESRATLAPGSKRNRRGTSTTAPTLGVTTRSRSQSARTKLDGAGEEDGCRKRKLGGRVSPERSKKGKIILEHSQESLSWMEDDDDDDDDGGSSAVSSPIRVPYKPEETNCDSELAKVYRQFFQKVVRHNELPTLYADHPPNFLVDDSTLLHIREPARKMVLRAAQFVVGISSSIDGEPLAQCSGFWIDFDNESRTGTVVTTALLIRTKHPTHDPWFCKDQYASDAKVNVHLRGYITVEGDLLYYQKHYNLAFLRIRLEVDQSVQLPIYSDNVECAQDIFELGRDKHSDLLINHGRVEYSNPTKSERHHHMYIQGPQRDRTYDKGGPVVDLDGKVVGMICSYSRASFIPSSILLKCFHLWRNFRHIPRPHLGLKFDAISLLNPVRVEQILIVCGIDEGLVVREVSGDSPAEKCGIRIGDVIECLNGKSISTTVELENLLLSIMEKSGDGLNSDLDLKIQVYCTRRNVRRVKVLTVNVSDDGEYCVPYCMPLPAGCVVTRPRNSPHRVSPGHNSVTPNEQLSTSRKER